MKQVLSQSTLHHWHHVAKVIHVPHNEKEYDKVIQILNKLIDVVGQDETHPLADLLELMGCCAEIYEKVHYQIPRSSPTDILKSLMEEHKLTQSDLPEIGNQSVVSQILHGKRKLNLRQIKKLAKRFHLPAEIFIE